MGERLWSHTTPMPMSEESYVDRTLSDLVDLVHKTQPSQSYNGDWYAAVEARNTIERIEQAYQEALHQGFQWAELLGPSKLFSDWPTLLHFKSQIDDIRSSFIQVCDEKLALLGYLASNYEAVDPALASRFQAAIRNIEEVRGKYMAPLTAPKATVRLSR